MEPKLRSGLKLSLLSNFAGTGWSALVQLVCIPLYIKFMGIESYGLIGFYVMLQAMLQVLDLGLSPTINREMARYSVQPEKMNEARDLVRTLEVGYWFVGVVIGVALLASSGWLSVHWIRASALSGGTVTRALMLMGILSIFQWPVSFYQGGLMGLHQQLEYNIARIVLTTLNGGGAVLVLWLVSPTITALLAWQAGVSALQAVVLMAILWKHLRPASRAPRFDPGLLRNIWRFAAGMGGIAAFSLVLGQADKVIVSKLFSLKVLGYYTLAGVFGTGLAMLTSSMFNSIYPRFSALVALADEESLTRLYHGATQLMSVLIIPVATLIAFFPGEVLQLWTRNAEVARNAAPIATVLVIGAAVNGLMFMPYTLQLAYGWTSIGLSITIFLTVAAIPALWFMAKRHGPLGVAFVWLGMQAVNMLIGVPFTHRRLLRHEMTRWLFQDVGPLVMAVVIVTGLGRVLITHEMSPLATSMALSMVLLGAFVAAICVAPLTRHRLLAKLSGKP